MTNSFWKEENGRWNYVGRIRKGKWKKYWNSRQRYFRFCFRNFLSRKNHIGKEMLGYEWSYELKKRMWELRFSLNVSLLNRLQLNDDSIAEVSDNWAHSIVTHSNVPSGVLSRILSLWTKTLFALNWGFSVRHKYRLIVWLTSESSSLSFLLNDFVWVTLEIYSYVFDLMAKTGDTLNCIHCIWI